MNDKPLTTCHIVSSLAPSAGGPSYSVPALIRALQVREAATILRSLQDAYGQAEGGHYPPQDAVLHAIDPHPLAMRVRASKSLRSALEGDALNCDILHTHGLWSMPNVYPAWAVRKEQARAKFVLSPRGMLGREALQYSKWKKRAFWALLQGRATHAASCLHATAEAEYQEIRSFGLTNPVTVIPNGIDIPELSPMPQRALGARTALSLGRIHPKKGLDRLVRAWAEVEAEHPDWRLRIVGPAEGRHDEQLAALARALGVTRLSIEGPIFGAKKLEVYQEAELFVLSTRNENFAITVAEALAAATPVISTKGAPWAELETKRCGWWIDHGVEPLAATLRLALAATPESLAAMGARGRAWMANDYSWDRVAREMHEMYHWLARGGEPPDTMRFA